VAISTYGVYWYWKRFGPGYHCYVEEYAERNDWTAGQWQAWQQEQLGRLLRASADAVPYYRHVWRKPERAAARSGRLDELPLLNKEAVREEPEAFVRRDLPAPPELVFPTSGSTGTPLRTRWTTEELRRSIAVREVRSAGWAGVSFGLPRATLSGRMVVPDPLTRGPFHRYNLVERQVYLSLYHIRADRARAYVRALERHGVRWLTGTPVAAYLLAQAILEQQLTVPPLLALITISEKAAPEMRQVLEQAYGCPVFDEYSCVEHGVLATECEHHRLHVSPDVGVVEILRPDGSPCQSGEVGEVVTTSLLCTSQPLVRYRLGDLAAWDPRPCPCGRQLPVIKEIVGRVEDVVVGPDGRQMVRFHLVFSEQPHVREGQVVQEQIDRIRLKVVPAPGFGPADRENLVQRVRRQLGPEVAVVVELVEAIPRTASGKFQAVVSHLPKRDATSPQMTGGR
jgi:phenylacetate-CoA ligase